MHGTDLLESATHASEPSGHAKRPVGEGGMASGVWSVEVLLRASSDFFPTFTARFATREEAERVAAGISETLAKVPSRDRRVAIGFIPAALAH